MKKLMHTLMLSCLKATELIEKQFVVKLSTSEKIRLAMHKSMCAACKNYEKQSQFIDKALSKNKMKKPVEIDDFINDLKDKIGKA